MDLRELVPRARRAINGPTADAESAPTSTLTDTQVIALIADALAEVIFFTGGRFPHTLEVTERDDTYNAPSAWAVEPDLSEAEATVVVAQAALSYIFAVLAGLKTSETIRDEGQEWSWAISATVLKERIDYLRGVRDKALELVAAEESAPVEAYISFVEARDRRAAAFIEPWVTGTALLEGQEMSR